MLPTRGCSISGGSEGKGRRTGFRGRAPKIFVVHSSQFRGLFKEFVEKKGGGLPAATEYPLIYQFMCGPWP